MVTHPSPSPLSGGFGREGLFLLVYRVVDDWLHARFGSATAPRARRFPGDDEFADAELLTVLLVGELCHCRRERAWLRQVRASYRGLFPALPSDGQFSHRAQAAQSLLHSLRRTMLGWADADLKPLRLLDSSPLPPCAGYRMSQSVLPTSSPTFGYNASKKQYFCGLHPQPLTHRFRLRRRPDPRPRQLQ